MKTLLLCPFGHADEVDEFPIKKTPTGEEVRFGCRGCGRVFVHEVLIKDIRSWGHHEGNRILTRATFDQGMSTEDGEWHGLGVVFVMVEDGATYDKPVPTGEAYHELYRQVTMGEPE